MRRTPSDEAVASTTLPAAPAPKKGPLPRDEYPLAHGPAQDHLENQAVNAHTRDETPPATAAEET